MKKLIYLLLFAIPLMSFEQTKPQKVLINNVQKSYNDSLLEVTAVNLSQYDFNVSYDFVEGKKITELLINNYRYGNTNGLLVMLYTENKLFGLKYFPVKGKPLYWTYFDKFLIKSNSFG